MLGNAYTPLASLLVVCSTCVASLIIVTVVLGTTAPVLSATIPCTLAVPAICACSAEAHMRKAASGSIRTQPRNCHRDFLIDCIVVPPLSRSGGRSGVNCRAAELKQSFRARPTFPLEVRPLSGCRQVSDKGTGIVNSEFQKAGIR